jgi:hypothetical protein
MDMPDLNHTLLLIIAVLVSLTRLVRLLFVTLRVCVKEYWKFRDWLRAYLKRRDESAWSKKRVEGATTPVSEEGGGLHARASEGKDGQECDAEPSHHVTPDVSRPLARTAVQR